MSCPYFNQCSETIKCGTCMHSDKRSYYVEYHEYPADNTFRGLRPWPIAPSPIKINEYPSPTSIEWPYLPCDDLRYPTGWITSEGLEVWDDTRSPSIAGVSYARP